MTADEAFNRYSWRCTKTKKLFGDPQFRGMILEIARYPGDDLAIKMLARMEAMSLGALCDDIATLECLACRGG